MNYTVLESTQHIQRATLILIVGTLLVHLTGFTKSVLVAMYYGTSAELDAYFLSLTPLRLIVGVLGSTIQVTLIPQYLEMLSKHGKDHAFSVLGTFVLGMVGIVITIAIGCWFGSPSIVSYLGTGFSASQIHLTAALLRISAFVLVLNFSNTTGLSLFHAHRQFVFSAFAPLINAMLALGYLIFFHNQGVYALMYGLIFGMFIQNCTVFRMARQFAPERWSFLSPLHEDIRNIARSMSFLVIGSSFGHVNVLIDQMMASTLAAGSISALHYANKFHGIFTSMFIMMVSKAAFPFFTQQVVDNDLPALKKTFFLTGQRMLYILLPVSCLIILFGNPIVRLVFQRGAFSTESTATTAGAWIAYSLGLSIQAIGILTARVYNALQENKILMYVSGASIGSNIIFNLIFMKIWGHVGIALSTSFVYAITTGILLYILHKKIGKLWE